MNITQRKTNHLSVNYEAVYKHKSVLKNVALY